MFVASIRAKSVLSREGGFSSGLSYSGSLDLFSQHCSASLAFPTQTQNSRIKFLSATFCNAIIYFVCDDFCDGIRLPGFKITNILVGSGRLKSHRRHSLDQYRFFN